MDNFKGFPMKPITQVTIVVTDQCNFRCSYCTVRKKEATLSKEHAEQFLRLCYPHMVDDTMIKLYGGEPLLAFEVVRHIVATIRDLQRKSPKKIRFGLSTNGWLLDDEKISFMTEADFQIGISFDGLVQEEGRKEGTQEPLAELIRSSSQRYPQAKIRTNSVFTPKTVERMAESLFYVASLKPRDMMFQFDLHTPWNDDQFGLFEREMAKLVEYNWESFQRDRTVPMMNFRGLRERKVITCFAARDRLSIHPGGGLWGCNPFGDYLQPGDEEYEMYFFGTIEDFLASGGESYRRNLAPYLQYGQDRMVNDAGELCALCPDVDNCHTCPPAMAKQTGVMGVIPAYFCRVTRAEQRILQEFDRRKREFLDQPSMQANGRSIQ